MKKKIFGLFLPIVAMIFFATCICAEEDCVKPWTIPDKWEERGDPPLDPEDTFDPSGANPDVYIAPTPGNPGTGYTKDDIGTQLVLKTATPDQNITPGDYYATKLPGGPGTPGANTYSENIANCNQSTIPIGEVLTAKPGNMVGPTTQGTEALIAKDPFAFWNTATNRVEGSNYGDNSPRIGVIPLNDPNVYTTGMRNGRNADLKTTNIIGIFIEDINADGDIVVRIAPIAGVGTSENCGNQIDDDGDTYTDCDDPECANDPRCPPIP